MGIQRNTNKKVHEWAPRAPPPGTPSERPLRPRPPGASSGHALWAHPAGHTEFAPGGVSATRLFWTVFPYIYLFN